MSPDYMRLFAAFHTMLGRSQQSRRCGDFRRSLLQINCASRIWERMTKTKY